MLHISPWATCAALMQGAARHLLRVVCSRCMGPISWTASRPRRAMWPSTWTCAPANPLWGLRRLADVVAGAQREGLVFVKRVAMPANNLVLVFRRG